MHSYSNDKENTAFQKSQHRGLKTLSLYSASSLLSKIEATVSKHIWESTFNILNETTSQKFNVIQSYSMLIVDKFRIKTDVGI